MAILSNQLSLDQLKRAVSVSEQIDELKSELASILGGASGSTRPTKVSKAVKTGKRRGRPPGIKSAISELLKEPKAAKLKKPAKKKRAMSEEGRKRIADAQKKRWAAKKAGK